MLEEEEREKGKKRRSTGRDFNFEAVCCIAAKDTRLRKGWTRPGSHDICWTSCQGQWTGSPYEVSGGGQKAKAATISRRPLGGGDSYPL